VWPHEVLNSVWVNWMTAIFILIESNQPVFLVIIMRQRCSVAARLTSEPRRGHGAGWPRQHAVIRELLVSLMSEVVWDYVWLWVNILFVFMWFSCKLEKFAQAILKSITLLTWTPGNSASCHMTWVWGTGARPWCSYSVCTRAPWDDLVAWRAYGTSHTGTWRVRERYRCGVSSLYGEWKRCCSDCRSRDVCELVQLWRAWMMCDLIYSLNSDSPPTFWNDFLEQTPTHHVT